MENNLINVIIVADKTSQFLPHNAPVRFMGAGFHMHYTTLSAVIEHLRTFDVWIEKDWVPARLPSARKVQRKVEFIIEFDVFGDPNDEARDIQNVESGIVNLIERHAAVSNLSIVSVDHGPTQCGPASK